MLLICGKSTDSGRGGGRIVYPLWSPPGSDGRSKLNVTQVTLVKQSGTLKKTKASREKVITGRRGWLEGVQREKEGGGQVQNT